MDSHRPATPPTMGHTMAFLSGASSPAATPAPDRRSPFGAFAGATPPLAASPPAPKRGRASSHEPPLLAPDRSRSAQWRARLLPRARRATGHRDADDTVRESARKLQHVIDTLERQRADDRKWLADNAKHIDKMEWQVREQTKEAIEYLRAKCTDVEARLAATRAQLDAKIRIELAALETKMVSPNDPSALTALDSKFQKRIDGFNQAIKAHMQLTKQHWLT